MRVYCVNQNLVTYDESHMLDVDLTSYCRSRAEAKRLANSIIKAFTAYQRGYDKGFRIDSISWGAEIVIQACDFGSTDKAMLIRLLNTEGGYFASQDIVDRWTPADKWNAPLEGGEE